MENISVIAIYADEKTSHSGIHTLEEALNFFEQFPWNKEIQKSKETGIKPILSLVARQDNDSFMNIQCSEEGTFSLDVSIVCKKGLFDSLFKKEAELNPAALKKDEIPGYIQKFFEMDCQALYEEFIQ